MKKINSYKKSNLAKSGELSSRLISVRRLGATIGFLAACIVGITWLHTERAAASGTPVSLTTLSTPVAENFDTLANTGTANPNTALPTGWGFVEAGTNANTTYAADTGAGTGGNTYSYGSTGSTERAYGELTSGTLQSTVGACFTNNTGSNIGVLEIAYTGEQWRSGDTANVPDRLDFQYSLNATSLSDMAATWVDVNNLDFTGPITTAAAGALDGNLPANRAALIFGIDNLTIPNGATFFIRWVSVNIAGTDDALSIDDFSITPAGPSLAKVKEYQAYAMPEGNLLRWQSSFETNNLGFQVYREEAGKRVLVTPELIAGSTLKFGAATLGAGDGYSWWDRNAAPDSVYWIQDVSTNGRRTWHGPLQTSTSTDAERLRKTQNSQILGDLRPANLNEATALHTGQVLPESLAAIAARRIVPGTDAWLRQLQLAAGAAVKIGVRQHGWYRVPASQLTAAGLPANADVRNLQLYADGVQTPIIVRANDGNVLGADGYIEFYGLGLDIAASDTRAYWLIAGNEAGLRYGPPARIAPGPRGKTGVAGNSRSFTNTVGRDDRAIYIPAVNNGVAANYFSAVFNGSVANQRLQVARLDAAATTLARVEVTLQGFTEGAHRVRVALNNHELGLVDFAAQESPTARFNVAQNLLTEGENTLSFNTLGAAADVAGVISSRISYAHRFEADDNQLLLTPENTGPLSLSGFTQPSVRVFDLTDANRAFELAARVTPDTVGHLVTLNGTLTGRTLLAVAESRYLAPASVTANEASNWTTAQRAADFIILTPAAFRAAVAPLAAARNGQGLQTEVISVEDIYDEWNGGAPDFAALRNFLHWTRSNWATVPRYVLLAGDASYDPRNYLGFGAGDLVPTGGVDTIEFETASDESLVDFDGDGIGEMALGRLPAKTEAQMQLMANRAANFAPFANGNVVFVADRPDGYDFEALNAAARAELPRGVEVSNINRQALGDVETRAQVINAINQGPAIVQYAGHGSVQVWTGAPLLNVADTRNLTNGSRLPFFSLMTCLNGYFVDQTNESLAEALLTAPNGGGIAVWGSTGLTAPASQAMMDRELFRALYQTGAAPRLGDAVRQAKAATSDLSVRRTWVLFGDPTLRIR